MEINVTFVIQGINFGISYMFLKYFFLKPAVLWLNNREMEYQKLLGDLARDDDVLQKKIDYKGKLIERFRAQVKVQFPMPEKVTDTQKINQVTYCLSNATIDLYQEKLKKVLITKATDAC